MILISLANRAKFHFLLEQVFKNPIRGQGAMICLKKTYNKTTHYVKDLRKIIV